MTVSRARWRIAVLSAVACALLLVVVAGAGCGGSTQPAGSPGAPIAAHSPGAGVKVTFVELGSNSCIPCKEMRPVMDAIRREFGDQINVVFYDVWKDDAPAKQYGIQYIPTQVFLDEKGVEFHRHVGFYPQADIEALLLQQGLHKLTTQ